MRYSVVFLIISGCIKLFAAPGPRPMPPIDFDPPPAPPSYVQVSYVYEGDKISGLASVNAASYAPGTFLGNAIVDGACLDMNNQWNVSVSAGWNGWDGWYVNRPKSSVAPVSNFGTQKSFYWNITSASANPSIPYIAYFTYSFGYNTDSSYTTYWSALGWDNVYSQMVNLGGVANTWQKSGTNHDTYRIGPILVWGFPTSPGMAGTIATYSKRDWWLGWNGDSCLWGVELYQATPQTSTPILVPFTIAATTLNNGSWVDIPLNTTVPIDTSQPVVITNASIAPYSQSFVKNVAYVSSPGFDLSAFVQNTSAALSIRDPEYPTRSATIAAGSVLPPTGLTDGSVIYINGSAYLRVKVTK